MMQRIGAYFIGIAAAAMAVSLAEACLRRGALRRAVRLAGGVVLIVILLVLVAMRSQIVAAVREIKAEVGG